MKAQEARRRENGKERSGVPRPQVEQSLRKQRDAARCGSPAGRLAPVAVIHISFHAGTHTKKKNESSEAINENCDSIKCNSISFIFNQL